MKRRPEQADARARASGEKLSLNFQNIEVRSLLQVIADFTNFNVVTSDTVTGTVTLRLKDVPWDQALDIILQAKGLGVRKNGNVLWIAPKDELASQGAGRAGVARRRSPSSSPAHPGVPAQLHQGREVAKGLTGSAMVGQAVSDSTGQNSGRILSPRGSVIFEQRTNQLFVTDIPSKLEEIQALIAKIDIPVRQVLIEARIVEADRQLRPEPGRQAGLRRSAPACADPGYSGRWQTSAATIRRSARRPDRARRWTSPTRSSSTCRPIPGRWARRPPPSRCRCSAPSANRFLNLELSALEADGKGKIVSSPRVITADQVKALIEQGEELPYQQATSSGATVGAVPQGDPEARGHAADHARGQRDARPGRQQGQRRPSDAAGLCHQHQARARRRCWWKTAARWSSAASSPRPTRNEINKVPLLGDIPYKKTGLAVPVEQEPRLARRRSRGAAPRRATRCGHDRDEGEDRDLLVFITPKIVTDGAVARRTSATASAGFQLTATQVAITSFTADIQTLQPYEQTALTVQLGGVTIGTPVSVQLSSGCVAAGRATLTPVSVTTSTGVATFTYRDQGCGAFNTVDNLQASVTGAAANAGLQLTLTAPAVSSISFVSATPDTIYLRGSGFVENSNVSFKVLDANGTGVPNAEVTLESTTLTGGLLLEGGSVPVSRRTDSTGNVVVRVNAGTVPTPVRIKATLTGTTISTVSSSLAIAVGLPSQLNFSLSQRARNIEGYDVDGTQNTYTIIASDRLGNPVPDGTAINFVTEGGQVEAIRFSALSNGLSSATANFQSSSPRPRDGRITVTAYALGEESFLDTNGDNVYTQGEDYQDLGDVFLDRLYNGTFNAAEDQFISLSIAGTDACTIADSPLLARDVSIPSRAISNTGVLLNTCVAGWSRAYVRRAIETVLSTSTARPVYGTALPAGAEALGVACPSKRELIVSYAADDQPVKTGFYDFGSVEIAGAGKTGVFTLFASDANPVALNPMAAGTTITATATTGMTASVFGGSPVPSTNTPTGVSVSYGFDDTTTSGTVIVTFASPGGLRTAISQHIKRAAVANACP
jgi:type IV pilus secretin PilQ/predicted competence protein